MRSNSMKTCAVGAMLFGGTLGAASTAQAGLVFTNAGVAPTVNYAYTYNYGDNASFTDRGFSAVSTSLSGLNVAWSATTASGFSTTVTPSVGSAVVTTRTFTVTGTEQVSFAWSRSYSLDFGIVTGPTTFAPVPGLGAGWVTRPSGISQTTAAAGSVTVTLAAGNYYISSYLNFSAIAGGAPFFNFAVVPAPGAIALLGAAGIMARRRRN